MSESKGVIDESKAIIVMEGFDQMRYWLSVNRKKFSFETFESAVPAGQRKRDRGSLTFAPRGSDQGLYHAHLSWSTRSERIELEIQYCQGGLAHAEDEREPYAEEVMAWLGLFFGGSNIVAHSHARFRFSSKRRRVRFPLTLTTPPPCEAQVSGLALRLPTKPLGAESVRLTLGGPHLYAEVVREGSIDFASYSLNDEININVAVLNKFLEEIAS